MDKQIKETVIQFGEGGFLRGFVIRWRWHLSRCLKEVRLRRNKIRWTERRISPRDTSLPSAKCRRARLSSNTAAVSDMPPGRSGPGTGCISIMYALPWEMC